MLFFFNDTATTEIYTLSLHDALPISVPRRVIGPPGRVMCARGPGRAGGSYRAEQPGRGRCPTTSPRVTTSRSEEHTSELQSRQYLVCRLLLEKKKRNSSPNYDFTTAA